MKEPRPAWITSLLPARTTVSQTERLRAAAGALLAILTTGLLCAWMFADLPGAVWLVAPMGATAVLLFALSASPLAQPWPVIGGNTVAAVIGVSCAQLIAAPVPAAAAIFLSIGAMLALRCLHPPSGAVALTAVLGGPAVHALGYGFVLVPVLLNSVLMVASATVYHRAVGRRYPHSQQLETPHPHGTADAQPSARLGFTREDLHAVLRTYDQVLDVSADQLETLFLNAERQAHRRRFGETRCGDVASRDVVTVEFGDSLADAWALMHRHAVHALPVVDRRRRVIGIVTRTDYLRHVDPEQLRGLGARLRSFLTYLPLTHSRKPEVVGQIMTPKVVTLREDALLVEVVPLMSDAGLHHVPVVNEDRVLVGILTQSDCVAALYEASLAELGGATTRAEPARRPTLSAA